MLHNQNEAWVKLKKAIDEYSQNTGAEVSNIIGRDGKCDTVTAIILVKSFQFFGCILWKL